MNDGRQKNEKGNFYTDRESEALKVWMKETELFIVKGEPGNPTGTERLMEAVCELKNFEEALKRVKANKGCPGIDGMRIEELTGYLRVNWTKIREELLTGTYKPSPVKQVEIEKPDGGKRKLGIPTVKDRFVQQAILQVLQERFDKTFSEQSYGFRPKKSAWQAIQKAQEYIRAGYGIVVDIDLEQFFDNVNHDRLMSRLAKIIQDKRILKIIRAFLNSGIMENGLEKQREKGTPQGGNLSPFLSNIVLDELDKELEKRGHKFVRYADDCNIYVRSIKAGERVMESITRFINTKLKLKVNQEKSAVDTPDKRKFLGYSFTKGIEAKLTISVQSLKRFKDRIREITNRNRGISLIKIMEELAEYMRGWIGYYYHCQTIYILKNLDSWIRRKIRCYIWKQLETFKNRAKELILRGVSKKLAYATACKNGLWSSSRSKALNIALSNSYMTSIGFLSLTSFVKV